MITLILSSCNTNNNAATTPTAPQVTESALPNLGKFVAVVPKSSDVDYSFGNEVVKQKIIESIANDRGVLLDFEIIELSEDDFTNELNQLLSSSTYIDCIVADYDMMPTYASLPLIKPIDTLLSNHGANLYNTIDQSYWNEVKYNDAIYGIPSMPYPEKSFMMARGDTLAMFTTEPVTSYSSLLAICKFYKFAGYEYPLAVTWDQLIDLLAYTFRVSAEPYYGNSKSGFYMREQSRDYTEKFLEEIKILYENGYLNPNIFTATEDEMKAEFMAGRSAIYVSEYDNLISDRNTLKSTFPSGEMKLIAPYTSRFNGTHKLSGEEKVDKVLMFTQNGQNSEALMTYLDWAYSNNINYNMLKLGAYGQQLMFDPSVNEYRYLDQSNTPFNKPYDGLYTLGLSTDLLYKQPTHANVSEDIMAINTLQKDIDSFIALSQVEFETTVPLNDAAKTALNEYTQIMRTATELYIKGEITIDDYNAYERQCRNSGLLNTLAQEIGVAYLYKIGELQ